VWQSSLSDSNQSKFGWNLAGGSIETGDFGADVNSRGPLNYSVFMRHVQLGQSTISGGITVFMFSPAYQHHKKLMSAIQFQILTSFLETF